MFLVEFPNLFGGIAFNVRRVAFQVFGIEVYWYGVIISLGLFLCTILALKQCERFNIKKDDFLDALMWAVPSSLVGARLYYSLFQWRNFSGNWTDIFNLRTGGIAIYGGIFGAVLATIFFTRKRKINTLSFLDFASVYLPLGQAIGRWGNFVNQEAFGMNTTLPWGMRSEGTVQELSRLDALSQNGELSNTVTQWQIEPFAPVHPTFLYESIWNLFIFGILLWARKKKKFNGQIFFSYLALYGLGRFWVEGLRIDSLMLWNMRVSQVVAALCCILFTGITVYQLRRGRENPV